MGGAARGAAGGEGEEEKDEEEEALGVDRARLLQRAEARRLRFTILLYYTEILHYKNTILLPQTN